MIVIAVRTKNYIMSEPQQVLAHFADRDKAIAFCEREFKRITPSRVSPLLPPDESGGKYFERFEYTSRYGGYRCAYELVPITIQ